MQSGFTRISTPGATRRYRNTIRMAGKESGLAYQALGTIPGVQSGVAKQRYLESRYDTKTMAEERLANGNLSRILNF